MNVKELITELLEYDLDATVEVSVHSSYEEDEFDFSLKENGAYLEISIDLRDKKYALLDERDHDDMKREIEDLKNRIEELEEEQNE